MAGEIKHEWNGTILTITSDSGTSSMDLKGGAGDLGPRGPQGPAGVIYGEDGAVLADNLVTTDYVDTIIENLTDFSKYATVQYVDEKVVEAATGGTITLESYATKDYVDQSATKTTSALEDVVDGYVRLAIGELGEPMKITIGVGTGLKSGNGIKLYRPFEQGKIYHFTIVYSNGTTEEFYTTTSTTLPTVEVTGSKLYTFGYPGTLINSFVYSLVSSGADGFLAYLTPIPKTTVYPTSLTVDTISDPIYVSPVGIPIDQNTLKINENNQIYVDMNFGDYATKEYVVNQVASVASSGTLSLDGVYATQASLNNYYTKTEIDALMDAIPAFTNAEEMKF